MHRSRFYRNPALYHSRSETLYGVGLSQNARNVYRRTTTPFSPLHKRDLMALTHYNPQHPTYANPRFADRSKYVWTANKQQNSSSQQPSVQTQTPAKINPAVRHEDYREISPLAVTVLDPAEAVIRDIAAKLHEEKVYLIRKVVDGIGVKRAIKLFYATRLKEANGGILVQNGKRRRTPGGVYLTLLRELNFIPKNEIEKVFLEIKRHESKLKIAHYHETY